MTLRTLTFPLVPRRRLLGLAFGAMHGGRRGSGSDVAGSRPYVPGDDPDTIDWSASARLSSARGTDEFIVREHFADEAPRVVIVSDRRPDMTLCPPDWPWLAKGEAAAVATSLIVDSVDEARGLVGFVEYGFSTETCSWAPPATNRGVVNLVEHDLPRHVGPEEIGGVAAVLEFLAVHRRSVPAASFVFVLSDFLVETPLATWERALDRGWDVVPVVIQDPVWEQSFPDLDGIVAPVAAAGGRTRLVRMRKGESARWRAEHIERRKRLLDEFGSLGIQPVLVSSTDSESMFESFLDWATERQASRSRA